MSIQGPGGVDLWYVDDLGSGTVPNPMLRSGKKLTLQGQTGNTVAGNIANMGVGTVAVGVIASLTDGTVTISDSRIVAGSFIFCQLRTGTTTPGATTEVFVSRVEAPGTGSVVVHLYNVGTGASLATDYQLWYWVVN